MTKCLTVEGVCGTGHSRRALALIVKHPANWTNTKI